MIAPRKVHRRPLSYWLSMLLLAVLAIGLAFFLWVGATHQDTSVAPATGSNAPGMSGERREMVVRNMTLEGRDEEGNPFHIEAARSRRPENDPGTMILENAIGEIGDSNGEPVHFKADSVTYHQDSRVAELKGNVMIEKPARWTLTGPLVYVDTRNSTLQTDRPVVVRTDAGVVHAQGMRSDKENGRTIFNGPVQAIFEASVEEDADDEDDEDE